MKPNTQAVTIAAVLTWTEPGEIQPAPRDLLKHGLLHRLSVAECRAKAEERRAERWRAGFFALLVLVAAFGWCAVLGGLGVFCDLR